MALTEAAQLIAAGNRAEQDGRIAEACALYRRAIEAEPRRAAGWLNLGGALEAGGDAAGAVTAYRAVLEFDPGNPFACYNLAISMLARRGEEGAAAALLGKALERKPDFVEAHIAMANALDTMGSLEPAAEHLRIALKLRPDHAGAWYNYGLVLRRQGRYEAAETALRRALQQEPRSVRTLLALGALLRSVGRIDESLQIYATARRLAPQDEEAESGELFSLILSDLPDSELVARHRAFGARLERAQTPRLRRHGPGEAGRRLRIGYVSGDLYRHPVALFLIPVLARHDRAGFDVHCYMTGTYHDEVSAELRGLADGWRDVASLDDEAFCEMICGDGIDILVDLSGHTGPLRLGVFGRRPAPVQASWLGYLHTLGMRRIAFRLCDAITDPPGRSELLHTETLVRLPRSQWCYRPLFAAPEERVPPAARNGFVTFGSFNHPSKISAASRRQWNELLRSVPDSRLVAVGVPEGRAAELQEALCAGGVERSRVSVVSRVPLDQYFAWLSRVDIALDTSPYSGGTTTCDALWMGVPVVTVPGTRSMSRSAASLLAAVGLGDWVADSPQGYVRLAAAKARDVAALAALRSTLRGRMRASPLMDEAGFTRDLENAYRQMWREWCENPGKFEG